MNLPREVAGLLEVLLSGIGPALGKNLAGVYLRGSLAMDDFIPDTSDVDVLAVTEQRIDAAGFATLTALHTELAALPNPYASRIEIAYIARAALKRFEPGLHHPTLGQGETLAWSEHRDNWILERWTVREHGITLLGPDPRTLIDSVSADDLRAAVRARLSDWADWANQPDDPDWLLPRSHKAYVVETMCRALYTLACGELPSKSRAVAWAMETLPAPWRSTAAQSRDWRTDGTVDPALVPEVRRYVLWTAAEGAMNHNIDHTFKYQLQTQRKVQV